MKVASYIFLAVFVILLLAGYLVNNYYFKSISGVLVTNIEFNEINSFTKEIILHTNYGKFIIPANVQEMAYSLHDNKRMIKIISAVEDDEHFNNLNEKIKSLLSREVVLNQTIMDIEYIDKNDGKVVRDLYYLLSSIDDYD